MQIVYKNIKEIKPYKNNPRNNDNAVEAVANSIKEFGFKNPIIVDKDNVVIAGHTRLRAAKRLNLTEVPVIVASDLSEEQIKAFRLADNKTAELAEWDDDLLSMELSDILDINMEDFGFDVDDLLAENNDDNDLEVEEDEIPEVDEENEPVAKLGDIWQLGNHRLMCGDSTSKEQVENLLGGGKASLLITDPPYNVNIESKSKNVLKSNNYSHIENDNLSLEDFKDFLGKVFKNAYDSLTETASYYVFSCQGGDSEMMMMMMRESGLKCRHQIIWVKDAPVFSMGRLDYDYKHEPILYGWKKSHHFYRKGEQDKSVWEYKRTANKLHPTMKPVELICNILKNSSLKKDNILDLFGGSGSTLIACEQLNRNCYMMELDPKYVDVIIKRWENYTGQKAKLIKNYTFN